MTGPADPKAHTLGQAADPLGNLPRAEPQDLPTAPLSGPMASCPLSHRCPCLYLPPRP